MSQQPDTDFIALQSALAGEYSLDREIGRGGMGIVYLAREVRLARPVAIKVLPSTLARRPELREAFLREARTAAGLTHPNIVQVFAVGERDDLVYIVMAYVEGTTLGERIRSRGPLRPGQAARVMREVAWALAYAHGAGLVHRDVTAENILLERGSERALVTDFGIASAMQTNALSVDGRVMGNAHYVSPEQATGERLDARSDLYSLGVAGYYALTGRLPFDGETSAEVVNQHLTATAPAITSVAPSVPPRLAAAVERCLHKWPIRRYRNAESFAEAIDLAFEHAKEIPAPLRVWLNQSEKELSARLGFIGIGSMSGVALALATQSPTLFLVPFVSLLGLSYIPTFNRLRRLLAEGFVVDDLHAAMREHQLARSEEMEYERMVLSPRFNSVMRVMLGASLGLVGIGAYLAWRFYWLYEGPGSKALNGLTSLAFRDDQQLLFLSALFFGLAGLTISGVAIGGEFFRHRLANRIASVSIAFWKSKWGARLGKLAGMGLKPAERPALGMPLLTEVALGRATDHLFQALPKATRKELAALPGIVKHLEHDATALRSAIDALDDQLAAFDRANASTLVAGDETSTVEHDLRSARTTSAERLAATVAALESIRLDLLRLQMGNASIASVTASLQAAHRVGEQISLHVLAQSEVERVLRAAPSATSEFDAHFPVAPHRSER